MTNPFPPEKLIAQLRRGVAIPAHPLALTADRRLDERRQRALTRYYADAGAGGIAVGVHTTQFRIRDPQVGLFEPVLALAAETLESIDASRGTPLIRIAGIVGETPQALHEATLAAELGYHLGLVSLSAFPEADNETMLAHLGAVAEVIPLFGFYLQPAVGGRPLDYTFWRRAAEIENLLAIKIAPFNRYASLDVARAVVDSGRGQQIALYTGNDENIFLDLLTRYQFGEAENDPAITIRGGLLGQWAVWTRQAVEDLETIRAIRENGEAVPTRLLTRAQQLTEANAAIFDAANGFRGCIPGIHEVLRRQGLLAGRWTLDPAEELSPGQAGEIERVYQSYPGLNDDLFVRENLDRWMR